MLLMERKGSENLRFIAGWGGISWKIQFQEILEHFKAAFINLNGISNLWAFNLKNLTLFRHRPLNWSKILNFKLSQIDQSSFTVQKSIP